MKVLSDCNQPSSDGPSSTDFTPKIKTMFDRDQLSSDGPS